MSSPNPEEFIDLPAALEEIVPLLNRLGEQHVRVEALLNSQPSPLLKEMDHLIRFLMYFLSLEHSIVDCHLTSIANYLLPNQDAIQMQSSTRELLCRYGVKQEIHFQVWEATESYLKNGVTAYAQAPEYPQIVQLLRAGMTQAKARIHEYMYLLCVVKQPFDDQHIKEFEPVVTYRMPINIDFTALRQTITDVVELLRPLHDLVQMVLPINGRLLAQFATKALPNNE